MHDSSTCRRVVSRSCGGSGGKSQQGRSDERQRETGATFMDGATLHQDQPRFTVEVGVRGKVR